MKVIREKAICEITGIKPNTSFISQSKTHNNIQNIQKENTKNFSESEMNPAIISFRLVTKYGIGFKLEPNSIDTTHNQHTLMVTPCSPDLAIEVTFTGGGVLKVTAGHNTLG